MRVFGWGTGKIARYLFDMFDLEKSFTILGFINFIYDQDILNYYGLRKCLLCTKGVKVV